MTEYWDMWKNYFNFSGRTTAREFWEAFLFNVIASLGIFLITNLLNFPFVTYIYLIAVCIPLISLIVRRIRDTGRAWQWVFLLFVPVVGWIALLVIACFKSVPKTERKTV